MQKVGCKSKQKMTLKKQDFRWVAKRGMQLTMKVHVKMRKFSLKRECLCVKINDHRAEKKVTQSNEWCTDNPADHKQTSNDTGQHRRDAGWVVCDTGQS